MGAGALVWEPVGMSAKRAKAERQRRWSEARAFLRAFMTEARALFARQAPAYYRRFPRARRPCETCAFRAWTDDDPQLRRGRDKTALNLLNAVMHDAPFYCHDGFTVVNGEYERPVDLAALRLCGGWGAVPAHDLRGAAARAARAAAVAAG